MWTFCLRSNTNILRPKPISIDFSLLFCFWLACLHIFFLFFSSFFWLLLLAAHDNHKLWFTIVAVTYFYFYFFFFGHTESAFQWFCEIFCVIQIFFFSRFAYFDESANKRKQKIKKLENNTHFISSFVVICACSISKQ